MLCLPNLAYLHRNCARALIPRRSTFGAVLRADTDIEGLIRRNLDAVGRTKDTAVTAFTDGCPGLRGILVDAGIVRPPILDWFHIAMQLQHPKQIAGGLSAGDPARVTAKAAIVEQVERLHWRLWNRKAKNARTCIDRIRAVMHHFRGERGERKSIAPARKLWTALQALDGYLTGQSDWTVNYARRHRAGLRVGTAITEATANFLVNRRMNKIATDALVATRFRPPAAGTRRRLQRHLGSGYGQKFQPANDPYPPMAKWP
jgi:hypothetical protein